MHEIDSLGRDTNRYIGNTDSLYNLIQRVSAIPIYTSGNEMLSELPSQISYQTSGTQLSSAFSNASIVSKGSKSYCKISHTFLFADPHRLDSIILNYPNATGYNILGVVCHVYNFVALPQAVINYFKFLHDNQIASMTVSEIMIDECTASLSSDISIHNSIEIFPNPCHDFVSIKHSGQNNLYYELFDLTGALLLAGYLVNSDADIDVNSLDNGIYYLRVYDSEKAFNPVKLMKFK